MYAYKYLKKEHLLEFKAKGSICINTLYNLWSEHEAIRDEFEGKSQLKVMAKGKPLSYSGEEFHQVFPKIKANKPNVEIILEEGATIIDNKKVSNAFVFCASLKLDMNLCKQFGYDSYYKIIDLDQFAEILFEKLNEVKLIMCYKADEVKYSNKEISTSDKKESLSKDFNDFWNICFTKPKKFRHEKEYRIVFVPQFSTEIKRVILDCPELLKYCEF